MRQLFKDPFVWNKTGACANLEPSPKRTLQRLQTGIVSGEENCSAAGQERRNSEKIKKGKKEGMKGDKGERGREE